MVEPISLTIFFPAYNEAENLARTVQEAVLVADRSPYVGDYEILIVNDGSTDGTPGLAETLACRYPAVRVLSHSQNRGYGAALKTGLYNARKDYVFFTDADQQFDLNELNNLLIHIPANGAVIGYRAPRRDPAVRRFNAWGWNLLNRLLFGLKIRDIDCAFKVFRREDLQALALYSRGAMINAELLIKLQRRGIRIKEAPVSHWPRALGAPTGGRPSVILRALREMVALYSGELGSVTHKQAVKFAAVGIINTLVDTVAYVALTRATLFFSDHLVSAKFFSFLVGTISSLTLNRAWTFGLRRRLTLREVARFYATVSLSLSVNLVSMNLLLRTKLYDLIALALATAAAFGISFILSKLWVFRAVDPPPAQPPE